VEAAGSGDAGGVDVDKGVDEGTAVGDENGSTQQPTASVRESTPSTEPTRLANFIIICICTL